MDFYLIKDTTLEVKDVDSVKGIVQGYFAAFNNVDTDGDIIIPGAFKKTIEENGPNSSKPRIKHLFMHRPTKLVGKLLDLKEDDNGLFFESQMTRTPLGKDVLQLYQDGILTEHSIGYNIIKKEVDNENETQNLIELKLWEGSVVTWGANEETPVIGIKSTTKEETNNDIEKIIKALHDGNYTDETFVLLEIQLKQLQQQVASLENKEPAKTTPKITEPSMRDCLGAFRTGLNI